MPLSLDEVRELYPRLRRFAGVVGDSDMEPDDLVQDALAVALSRSGPIDRPEAFLRTVMLRKVIDRRRRAARWRERMPLLAEPLAVWDRYSAEESVLERMSPTDRAVLFLSVVEGRPHKEIGVLLGVSEATVRQRAKRAKRRARLVVEEDVLTTVQEGLS